MRKKKKIPITMSITIEDVQQAVAQMQELQPVIEGMTDALKTEKKKVNAHVKTIKKFMKQTKQVSLTVNCVTFKFDKKEKVVVNMDRLETILSPDQILAYKKANTEKKESFKIEH
tara:strand:+ start:249 stop:593 length:345 start_codon:yes stop_codon:yes gene_type:complete